MPERSLLEELQREVNSLEVVFKAKGMRREDGKTAAEVEAERAQVQEDE